MSNSWFSTRIRFAVIIETMGLVNFSDSIYLFKSMGFDDAFERALDIGRRNERTYTNGDGCMVAWKFAEVISLDMLRSDSLEGVEVYSEPIAGRDPSFTIEHEFQPELSRPTQTI